MEAKKGNYLCHIIQLNTHFEYMCAAKLVSTVFFFNFELCSLLPFACRLTDQASLIPIGSKALYYTAIFDEMVYEMNHI